MDPITYLIIGGIILAVFIGINAQSNKWKEVAEHLGLEHHPFGLPGAGDVSGDYKGVPVSLATIVRGGGKHKQTFTSFECDLSGHGPADLTMAPEMSLSGLGKLVGMQDITVGHHELDRTFVIKSRRPEQVQRIFATEGVAEHVLHFFDSYREITLDKGTLSFLTSGFQDHHTIEHTLDRVVELAEILSGQRQPTLHEVDARMEDAQQTVEAALRERRARGQSASNSFDRPVYQPQDDQPDEDAGADKFGAGGSWGTDGPRKWSPDNDTGTDEGDGTW